MTGEPRKPELWVECVEICRETELLVAKSRHEDRRTANRNSKWVLFSQESGSKVLPFRDQ